VRRFLFALGFLAGAPALAWGPVGHRTVGEIAEHHLTPRARAEVAKLIAPQTLADVSTWADEIRYLPEWKKAEPWHFISIDDGETLATTARNPQGDVLEAMERMERTLRDPTATKSQRTEALEFLVHFVGDVHQPLHVGRRGDEGGNKVAVVFSGRTSDLHWVWDALIINDQGYSYSELARALDHPSPADVLAWQRATFSDWIGESLALRGEVYALPADGKINYLYAFEHWPTIRHRLLQAGVRLAGRLNDLFDPRSRR
jgi:nuclease S1